MHRLRTRLRLLLALGCLLLVPALAAAQAVPAGIPRGSEPATVVSVTDGDTLKVQLANGTIEPLRLIGIDAPETVDPNRPDGCFGAEAAIRLKQLLPKGRQVWLEMDTSDRDRFDRLLRYVWVEKQDGGVYLVNEVLVRDGYAITKRYPPDTKRATQLEKAQVRAQKKQVGMWSACDLALPTPSPTPASSSDAIGISAGQGCDKSYPTLCIPIGSPDLDCGDITARRFPVLPPDQHRFDGDHDGIGCESG
jgi:endonuclease YncB( thermonuclease family)